MSTTQITRVRVPLQCLSSVCEQVLGGAVLPGCSYCPVRVIANNSVHCDIMDAQRAPATPPHHNWVGGGGDCLLLQCINVTTYRYNFTVA